MTAIKTLGSPDLYTVGWIAALSFERAAATAMLDERHSRPHGFFQHQSDTNSYTWGKMGEHNVVIASLPAGSYGSTSAATTASNLLSSLPGIRIGLLVGIGGGVARPWQGRDIRLGDVVVSLPQGTTGGVIQYDLGKAKTDEWERKQCLSAPPQLLLQALASLQAEHELGDSEIPELLAAMPRKRTRTGPSGTRGINDFVHQGFENDRLFRSFYNHVGGVDCSSCDELKQVKRVERYSTDPEIHYGIIASGNTLVKDASTRDKILQDIGEECLCLEMEAAGLMNHFPCLVIRGISDYGDSHKNDRWQRYASATAAAYGKELLGYVPTRDLEGTLKALDVLKSSKLAKILDREQPADTIKVDEDVKNIQIATRETKIGIESLRQDNHLIKIHTWLSPPDTSINMNEALQKRQAGTGFWFLQSEKYRAWKTGMPQCLWLHGLPGAGKTILSAAIIEQLNIEIDSSHIVLEYFFDFADEDKQSAESLVRSLAAQLYSKSRKSRKEIETLFTSCGQGTRKPNFEALLDTFLRMVNNVEEIYIIIDALDECKTRKYLISCMERLVNARTTNFHLLMTSRKEEYLDSKIKRWLPPENIVAVQQDAVNHDIRVYVHERLRHDPDFEMWLSNTSVQKEIETTITKKAGGMFRWAACQLDILKDCLDLRMLRKALSSLPKTLEDTYGRVLGNIDEKHRDCAIRLLQFLTYSERPLTLQEAIDVIVVDPTEKIPFDTKLRIPDPRKIMELCPSLVTLVSRKVYRNKGGTQLELLLQHFSFEDLVDYPSLYDLVQRKGNQDKGETQMELQLAHFSVQQYLKSNRIAATLSNLPAEISVTFEEQLREMNARKNFTKICLSYLSCLDEHLTSEELRHKFPLAQYSARYWLNYAKMSETEQDVQESILNFFLRQKKAYNIWGSLFNADLPWLEDPYQQGNIATPLYYAALSGLQYTVQSLLNTGVDVNIQCGFYGNALQAASAQGYTEIVRLLLDHGADANAKGRDSLTDKFPVPQHIRALDKTTQDRAISSYVKMCQLQLQEKAQNLDNLRFPCKSNALSVASKHGYAEIVQLLLEKGASDCENALELAARFGHYDIVRLLLRQGNCEW